MLKKPETLDLYTKGGFGFTTQMEGSYYTKYKIQPAYFCEVNNIPFCASNIIKYILRHDSKNGIQDLLKAYDYACKWLEVYHKSTVRQRPDVEQFITKNKLSSNIADILFSISEAVSVHPIGVATQHIADIKIGIIYLIDIHYSASIAQEIIKKDNMQYNIKDYLARN